MELRPEPERPVRKHRQDRRGQARRRHQEVFVVGGSGGAEGLIGTYGNVDETAVRTAHDEWNAANLRVMSQFVPGRLIAPIQWHHALKGRPVIVRIGTFPTGAG